MKKSQEYKLSLQLKTETLTSYVFEATINLGVDYMIKTLILDKDYYKELVSGDYPPLLVAQHSVMFLLEREEPQQILNEFNAREIQNYFNDYEATIRDRFKAV